MASLNKVFLLGNLVRDPDLRGLPSGQSVCELRMAVSRRYRGSNGQDAEETCFVDVVVWGNSAKNCKQYLAKGSQIMVEGRLQLDQWEDRNGGGMRSRLRVIAEQVQFMNRRSGGAEGESRTYDDGAAAPEARRYGSAPAGSPGMPPMPEAGEGAAAPVDDIPF